MSWIQKQKLKQNCFVRGPLKICLYCSCCWHRRFSGNTPLQIAIPITGTSMSSHGHWIPVITANGLPTCVLFHDKGKDSESLFYKRTGTLPSLGPYWFKIYKISSELATGKKKEINYFLMCRFSCSLHLPPRILFCFKKT